MAEGINVRFAGPLQNFIRQRVGPGGLYQSASEYIRDLVRRDFEQEETRRSDALYEELKPGAAAAPGEFIPFDVERILQDRKTRRAAALQAE